MNKLYLMKLLLMQILDIFDFSNQINIFVGLLCGLKYTNIGGTFILAIGLINDKNAADIYLIGKKYFNKSYLYNPEIILSIKWMKKLLYSKET